MYQGVFLSNEGLKEGDLVFPIYTPKLRSFCFLDYMSGWPNEPHTIEKLRRSNYKPYETSTSHGFGPEESYFKIIPKASVPLDAEVIELPSERYTLEKE